MSRSFAHVPVMLAEVVELFAPVPEGTVVDATVGGAGHAVAILDSRPELSLVGLDRDEDAVAAATDRLAPYGERARVHHARFDRLGAVIDAEDARPVSGVLFDLGVSSHQLDEAERGFAFRHDGPVDMRMDRTQSFNAATPLNEGHVDEIVPRAARRRRDPLGQAHRPGHRRRPADHDHRSAGGDRALGHPGRGPAQGWPSGDPHVPGFAHRRQRGTGVAAGSHRRRHRRACTARPLRRLVVSLGGGPHREGAIHFCRHRRLHLSARLALWLRGEPTVPLLNRGARKPSADELAATIAPRAHASAPFERLDDAAVA